MAIYKAKKSNLTTLLNKSNIDFKTLSENTGIPLVNLSDYSKRKIMSISTAMTVSKELGCTIEELYEWNKTEWLISFFFMYKIYPTNTNYSCNTIF